MFSKQYIFGGAAALAALGLVLASQAGVAGGPGSVGGKIVYAGKAPAAQTVSVTKDTEVCGSSQKLEELIVGSGGSLANVVVWVEGVPEGEKAKKTTVTLDQVDCRYTPHVQAAGKGSEAQLLNSDAVLHNVHGVVNGKRDAFNVAMPTKGMKVKKKLRKPGLVKIGCDAGHTWMSAYIYVFGHPYYAVTDKSGKYNIPALPAGTYTLKTWHEKLGEKSQSITVDGKEDVSITYK